MFPTMFKLKHDGVFQLVDCCKKRQGRGNEDNRNNTVLLLTQNESDV